MPPALALAVLLPAAASARPSRAAPNRLAPTRTRQLTHCQAAPRTTTRPALLSSVRPPAVVPRRVRRRQRARRAATVAPCDPTPPRNQRVPPTASPTTTAAPTGDASGGFRANLEVWVVAAGGGDANAYDANASVPRLAPIGGFNHDVPPEA